MACAFQYAESDDTSDPAVGAAGGYVYQGNAGRDDLPLPSTLAQPDLRGVIPGDTIYGLGEEAAGGGGAAVFASSGAGSGAAWGLYILAALGLYAYANRRQA